MTNLADLLHFIQSAALDGYGLAVAAMLPVMVFQMRHRMAQMIWCAPGAPDDAGDSSLSGDALLRRLHGPE